MELFKNHLYTNFECFIHMLYSCVFSKLSYLYLDINCTFKKLLHSLHEEQQSVSKQISHVYLLPSF